VEPAPAAGAGPPPLPILQPAALEPLLEPPPRILPDWLERFGTTGGPGRSERSSEAGSIPRPGAPGVLIAEDSIAARHFLARLVERRGLAVRAVESAAELRAALAERAWSLLCVDIELPDAAGPAIFGELRTTASLADVPLVALVRDDEDAGRAAEAGVRRWLRKPFDGDEVDHLLARLGLAGETRP
jgi:CheY-like chemotaxis protein